ncbi:hypothetical protein [Bosea sp. NBC_00550]|uniref:hypothetical protein n=1 Tax=Bosea sp. NBC_00550 TaxID=2969621 RepID=UPI00222FA8BB|nr:hypothetical protein [Bosea sp. NBC_00550]UZF93775.1 hypothetical protein NWE53_06160 [Bosea sp. NBC_00550]
MDELWDQERAKLLKVCSRLESPYEGEVMAAVRVLRQAAAKRSWSINELLFGIIGIEPQGSSPGTTSSARRQGNSRGSSAKPSGLPNDWRRLLGRAIHEEPFWRMLSSHEMGFVARILTEETKVLSPKQVDQVKRILARVGLWPA